MINHSRILIFFALVMFMNFASFAQNTEELFTIEFDNYNANGKFKEQIVMPDTQVSRSFFVPGYSGSAIKISNKSICTYKLPFFIDDNEGSIECWIKRPLNYSRKRAYLITLYSDNNNRLQLRFENDNISAYISAKGKGHFFSGKILPGLENRWVHVAICWKKHESSITSFFIYYNGLLTVKRDFNIDFKLIEKKPTLIVGSYLNKNMPFNGMIDCIKISNKILYSAKSIPNKIIGVDAEEIREKIDTILKSISMLKKDGKHIKKLIADLKKLRRSSTKIDSSKDRFALYNSILNKLNELKEKFCYYKWCAKHKFKKFEAFPVSCMHKFNGNWESVKKVEKNFNIIGATNEYLNAQLLLIPALKDRPEKFNVKIRPFRDEKNSMVNFSCELFKIDLISGNYLISSKKWADILNPIKKDFSISPQRNYLPIWLTIHVSAGTKAGNYSSFIEITCKGKVVIIPVKIKVLNFALPTKPRFKTVAGFSSAMMGKYYNLNFNNERFKTLNKAYLVNMLKHKVSPKITVRPKLSSWNFGDSFALAPKLILNKQKKWLLDFKEYDKQLDELLPLGLNTIMFGQRGWVYQKGIPLGKQTKKFFYIDKSLNKLKKMEIKTLSPDMKKFSSWYIRAWYNHLKKRQLDDMIYTYTTDEPKPDSFNNIAEVCGWLHSEIPKLQNMVTAIPASNKNYYIDIWCPLNTHLNNKLLRQKINQGAKLWTYVCCSPRAPHLNFFIHQSGLVNRAVFWHAYKFGAEGFLYYEHALSLWEKRNVYKDPRWLKNAGTEGDGFLVYPGPDGPINSIRFEYVRMGIQDVEYFLMLKNLIKKLPTDSSLKELAEKLLIIPDSLIKNSENYCKDWKEFAERKRQVGLMIEKVLKALKK